MKKIVTLILLVVILLGGIFTFSIIKLLGEDGEILEISSEEELKRIYEGESEDSLFQNILSLPFSIIKNIHTPLHASASSLEDWDSIGSEPKTNSRTTISPSEWSDNSSSKINMPDVEGLENSFSISSNKEFSTTNIQVENVDEADITKTDGDYIYSLSDDKVIITDVRNPEKIEKVYEINNINDNVVPEEILLYNNKLVVIYKKESNLNYYSYKSSDTMVYIYDISNKERPREIKNYVLKQPYYTSRCINGRLYVISSGNLKKENNKIVTSYKEDGETIDQGYKGIKKIKNLYTNNLTILSMLDLNIIDNSVKVNSYLMDIENAYVSENNIYLLEEKYKYSSVSPMISSIFGVKGIFGIFDEDNYSNEESGTYTKIYKFNLLEDGNIKFDKRAEEKGTTINQFSIDEYKNNLRVALHTAEGSKVVVLDENMQKIGETENLAKGEKMYSSRFMGDRAYLVTYKTIDPLFAIDLSNPYKPKTLGKLKIPGYSTYLHPYDETHIIGIGMQTEEKVNRNYYGRVISTTATITGMKMALFDVSDIARPIQISDTVIGDRRTTSAVLTNHKALLFSKQKELIAIPINNYEEDFSIEDTSGDYSSIIKKYTSYNKNYISEGYFVYNLNVKDGFKLKGKITHDKSKKNSKYSYYDNSSRLLRGLYIENNLYTISEDYVKVNKLDDLTEISSLKIKED